MDTGFFESRNDPKNDPVLIWLNGGPGCSSLIGLFDSLGPSRIPDKSHKPARNAHSWNNNASVIFIEQPVNTGFSYSKNRINSSVAAANDMAAFLDLFFTKFKQYSTQPFHIAGQSYAGHWIPALGHEIVTKNYTNINLKSLLIGNGLTDCLSQYRHFAPMACGKGGHPAVLGAGDCKAMEDGVAKCEPYIKKCYDSLTESACSEATKVCNNAVFPIYGRSGRSHYDVRVRSGDEYKGYAPEWLNKAEVKKALGVESNRRYERCNGGVYQDVVGSGDWMLPRHRVIPEILTKIPVLAYSGDADFICAWLGNQAWTAALEWPGKQAFNEAKLTPISVNGKEYGKVKHANKFAFMQVYNAGHSVAQSQPEAGLDFVNRWMKGEWHT